ncbi:translocation and assembly module lipoprotein TamL [Mucilaginibacter myungsuensis]|uniref:BamA/TamA family outer membrane protein n=1 Tax=Mucilaginibacter myungsuensis TaxID=649104 RepID=A0A929KXB4_9SPHI|nr:BamA/TamA family outer membrane protein [Mucilaginibacter myungsuensis]MBE9662372.1 BamA/TamA family outer membrane protein [Mucilaginibacter myungsuensis]MDN3599191.1 BamA/TamA family outer membrane protein [Mucilaginibacter myungsuensis]
MGKRFIYLLVIAAFVSACSNTKYLTGNQKLYTGAEIKVDTAKKQTTKDQRSEIEAEMKDLVRPQPNSSILGLRYKLWIYNKTHARRNFIQKLLSGMGEPPVLLGDVNVQTNSDIMQNRLQNKGYFQAQTSGDTVSKGKTGKAIFDVQPGPSYSIRNIYFPKGKTDLDTAVAGTAKGTFLKTGDKYNLDVIKSERVRIDAKLKEEGFYYFSPENLIVRVDTPVVNHQVNLTVEVKPETSERGRKMYDINNIYIYPNYTLRDTSLMLDQAKPYRNYFVVQKREYVRDFVFKQTVQFEKGSVYNRTEHNKALNRFIELGPFKFVKNRFEDVSTPDSPKLNVFYFLTPYPRKSLQAEILTRTTSANFTGTQLNVSWRHRNAFKGAELLTISAFGGTDVQVSGQNSGYNVYQYGVNTSLSWPRFISPINFTNTSAFVPHTKLTLQYSMTNRVKLYSLNSFSGSFGYNWKDDIHKSHELNITNITYVSAGNVSQEYLDTIARTGNPTLKHVIDNQLTFGPSYSYTFTNTTENNRTNTWYFNTKVSTSALLLGIATGADTLAGKVRKIGSTPFNQYAKFENEFRFYHKTGKQSSIATRFLAGVGVPFGNSTIMPYSQQFFIGGSNSLRGFRARSIGPGSFQAQTNTGGVQTSGFLPDQSGDIKLEANIEYRPHLFSIVHGALFVDAGNVWNLNSQRGLEGGTFGKNFINQLAADVGFGLRFDVTVLVLRTDYGIPILQPYATGQRFKLDRTNGVFNLAIGYPF